MTNETKNEKWCAVSAFGRTAVYPTNEIGNRVFCSVEQQILPEADIKFRETYEYIVKLHNDRLRFKQKQRAKKNREDGYVKTNPIKESYIDESGKWIVNGISSVPNTNRKTCRRCKQCKDGCEFYDKGICRGIVYPTYPPQYDKCEFDK